MTDIERKEYFVEKLLSQYSEKKVDEILAALDKVEAYMIKKKLISNTLFDINDPESFYNAMQSTTQSRLFRLINRKIYGSAELGMQEYLTFLNLLKEEKKLLAEEQEKAESLVVKPILQEECGQQEPRACEKKGEDRLPQQEKIVEVEQISQASVELSNIVEEKSDKKHINEEASEVLAVESEQAFFFEWLKNKKSNLDINELKSIYAGIESFCLSTKILKTALFETNDIRVLNEVRSATESSKVLNYGMVDRRKKLVSAVELYISYVKEKCSVNNADIDTSNPKMETALPEKPMCSPEWNDTELQLLLKTYQSIQNNEVTKDKAVEKLSAQLRSLAEKKYTITSDFRNKESINSRLGELEYHFTAGKSGIKNTSGLLKNIVQKYRNDETEDTSIDKHERISKPSLDEKNSSDNTSIKSNDTETSKTERAEKSEVPQKIEENRVREAFEMWMKKQGMAENSAKTYASVIKNCSRFAISNNLSADSLYIIEDAKRVTEICNQIVDLRKQFCLTTYQTQLNKYCKFRNEVDKANTISSKAKENMQPTIPQKVRQPLWDKYEAAWLLDAYFKVEKGEISRRDAIEKVSRDLRQRAIALGYEIDDRFRNVAGITFQMAIIEFYATSGDKGINKPASLFEETVRLYKNNRREFDILLETVRGQLGEDSKNDIDNPQGKAYEGNKLETMREDCFVVPEELFLALGERTAHMVAPYVIAYTQDTDLRKELLSNWDHEDAAISSIRKKSLYCSSEQRTRDQKRFDNVCNFLRWCTFDLNKEIQSFVNAIFKERSESIDEIYRSNQILSKISATRDGDMILTPMELTEYFGGHTTKILNLLRQCKSDTFVYDAYTDTFLIDDETLAERVQKYVQELPDVFSKDRLNYILKQAERKEGISAEILEIAINQSYMLKMKQYRRKRVGEIELSIPYVETQHSTGSTGGVESQFYQWLAERASGDELSALYLKYQNLNTYFLNHKILSRPLFETTDLNQLSAALYVIETDREFANQYRAQKNKYRNALMRYQSFLRYHPELMEVTMQKPIIVEETKPKLMDDSAIRANRIAFLDWMKTQNLDQGKAFVSLTLLRQCNKFAHEKHLIATDLFAITDVGQVKNIQKSLLKDSVFGGQSKVRSSQLEEAFAYYVDYLNSVTSLQTDDIIIREHLPSEELHMQQEPLESSQDGDNLYYQILKEKFPKGFRAESKIELKKFKKAYAIEAGEEISLSDDEIMDEIRKITVRHEKMMYLPDILLSQEKKKKLLAYIDTLFAEGKTAIYYTALFEEFSDEFLGERIHSAEILKTYLQYINDGRFYVNRVYVAKDRDVLVDPMDEVLEVLRQKTVGPVTIEDLCAELPHLPKDVIAETLKTSSEIICNKRGESYFHINAIDLDDRELENIARIIQNGINTQQFITNSELRDAIRRMYPDLLERYEAFSAIGMRDALAVKFHNRFNFSANIISAKGIQLTTSDVFANFCKTHEHFTMGELNLLKEDLGSVIYFDTVYENALRISQNEFVSFETVSFDVQEVDNAIGHYCTGSYIALRDIDDFSGFPYVGVAWNSYLLEHFVADFSHKYHLLHTGFNASSSVGAIVRRDCGIKTFEQLLVTVLADSGHTTSTKEAFDYLIEMGYLAGRGLKRMDQIVIDAKVQRSKKG